MSTVCVAERKRVRRDPYSPIVRVDEVYLVRDAIRGRQMLRREVVKPIDEEIARLRAMLPAGFDY